MKSIKKKYLKDFVVYKYVHLSKCKRNLLKSKRIIKICSRKLYSLQVKRTNKIFYNQTILLVRSFKLYFHFMMIIFTTMHKTNYWQILFSELPFWNILIKKQSLSHLLIENIKVFLKIQVLQNIQVHSEIMHAVIGFNC